ncbi:MAG: hypothetical protein KC553_06915 [Nitrospina sp.]|nr:hypothetical protein [Nitrospina sp.]
MHESLKTKLHVLWIVLGTALIWWVMANRPSGPERSPHPENSVACANMGINGIKDGLIEETEDGWAVVYVTERWDQIPSYEQEQLGYYIALCKSASEKTEVRRASGGETLRTFVIDLNYRMAHGLPTGHILPGS